jgi:hypothetical protein
MPALAELLGDADPLALQVADGLDGLVREQLVAARMYARERRDRFAGIHLIGDPCRGLEVEVDVAPRDRIDRQVRHVADVCEPFGPQQVLGDVHRRDADVGVPVQPDRGRLRRSLVGERRAAAKRGCGGGCGEGGEKIAA